MENGKVFQYTSSDLVKEPVCWEEIGKNLTLFDKTLRRAWDKAVADGLFRYTLSDCVYKKLDLQSGEGYNLPCIAQLNPQRAANRRKRECFESMNDPFDQKQFNFTKIREGEILVQVTKENDRKCSKSTSKHEILLNISPIEYGHVLIAPYLNECLAQKLTQDSLLLACDILQLSSQPSFRLGFNSLHAWASINHLHFHGMYCEHELFGDVLPAEQNITAHCFLLDFSSPLPAFVFTIPDDPNVRKKITKEVTIITDYLHSIAVAYNVLLNRGKLLKKDDKQSTAWMTRTLIFPRNSSKDLLPSDPFDVACIEVGGHFPVKTKSSFDTLTPKIVLDTLKEAALDKDIFDDIVCNVKDLLLKKSP